jgi:hypothetical protein
MTYRPTFFQPNEWKCKCGCKERASHAFLSEKLLIRLDILRAFLDAPIIITSGFRCEANNAAVGGAERSYHLQGRAVDITTKDFSALVAFAGRLNQLYLYKFTELIPYPNRVFLHLAV